MRWEILIRPFEEFEGDGEIDIEPLSGNRLGALIVENYRRVSITASNRPDLDWGIKTYQAMKQTLPKAIRISTDDEEIVVG